MASFETPPLHTDGIRLEPGLLIIPEVIERLASGQFEAKRSSSSRSLHMDDRRDTLSPLAITKRCIRYEPDVFRLRHKALLDVACALNDPKRKIILLEGAAGSGKTAFCRALVELIGGAAQQVIWYDVGPHHRTQELLHYLLEISTYLAAHLGQTKQDSKVVFHSNRPIDSAERLETALNALDKALEQLRDVPLLIVLDNLQSLVNDQLKLTSNALKLVLNTFLNYDNIKVLLSGQRLPHQDLRGAHNVLLDYALPPLSIDQFSTLLNQESMSSTDGLKEETPLRSLLETELLHTLYEASCGRLWLARAFAYYARYTLVNLNSFTQLYSRAAGTLPSPQQTAKLLLGFLEPRFSWQEQQWLALLGALRHPLPQNDLQTLGEQLFPSLALKETTFKALLQQKTLLKPLLRINLPPQQVLRYLQQPRSENTNTLSLLGFDWWVSLLPSLAEGVSHTLGEPSQWLRIHRHLENLYSSSNNSKPLFLFTQQLSRSTLEEEAYFHKQQAQLLSVYPPLFSANKPEESDTAQRSIGLFQTTKTPSQASNPKEGEKDSLNHYSSQQGWHDIDHDLAEEEQDALIEALLSQQPGYAVSPRYETSTKQKKAAPDLQNNLINVAPQKAQTHPLNVNQVSSSGQSVVQVANYALHNSIAEALNQSDSEAAERALTVGQTKDMSPQEAAYWQGAIESNRYQHNEASLHWQNVIDTQNNQLPNNASTSTSWIIGASMLGLAAIASYRNQQQSLTYWLKQLLSPLKLWHSAAEQLLKNETENTKALSLYWATCFQQAALLFSDKIRLEEAERCWHLAAQLLTRYNAFKNLIELHLEQGSALIRQNQPLKAQWAFEESVKLASTHQYPVAQALAHDALGELFDRLGQPKLAVQHLKMAYETQRPWATIPQQVAQQVDRLVRLAQLYHYSLKQPKLAKAYYQHSLKLAGNTLPREATLYLHKQIEELAVYEHDSASGK